MLSEFLNNGWVGLVIGMVVASALWLGLERWGNRYRTYRERKKTEFGCFLAFRERVLHRIQDKLMLEESDYLRAALTTHDNTGHDCSVRLFRTDGEGAILEVTSRKYHCFLIIPTITDEGFDATEHNRFNGIYEPKKDSYPRIVG